MRKYLKGLVVGTTALGILFGGNINVSADEGKELEVEPIKADVVVDEKWGLPVYVYGSKLTEEQVKKLAEDNGFDMDALETYSVDGHDQITYLGDGNPNSNMYSSAIITRTDKGTGIEVVIPNEENITKITKDQYTNAMITAGVEDAKVIVDSPVAVTGESALTGIYKAYDEKGEELDKDRMEVAQEELETTASLAEGLNEDEKSALDDALIEIKQQLADLKEGQLTEENIEKIITKALDKRGLGLVVSEDEIEKLVKLFMKYGKTSAIDSEAVKQQLGDLADSVGEKLGDLKNWADEVDAQNKVVNFFKGIWEALVGLFNKGSEIIE